MSDSDGTKQLPYDGPTLNPSQPSPPPAKRAGSGVVNLVFTMIFVAGIGAIAFLALNLIVWLIIAIAKWHGWV